VSLYPFSDFSKRAEISIKKRIFFIISFLSNIETFQKLQKLTKKLTKNKVFNIEILLE